MPEGHSIHRLARQISDVFGGQRVSVSSPQGRFADGAALLDGREVIGASAHGKQLFVHFGPDGTHHLRVHLGLYGAFSFGGDESFAGASSIGAPRRIGEREVSAGPRDDGGAPAYAGPPPPVGAVRLRMVSEHGWADLRGASACEVLSTLEMAGVRSRLGPDPLADDALGDRAAPGAVPPSGPGAEFARRLGATRTMIGTALMDQARVAGVGNIYRAEALFRGRLDPWQSANRLRPEQVDGLWRDLVSLMRDGVRDGRIITTAAADRPEPGADVWPEQAYYVYQRAGQGCRRCPADIAVTEVAGRKLYWCPGCQG
ncbi:Fpg/Nei family DNA glycosylase [Zhihengliuella salsuginis]|uniref:DNA-(apurinic or apyrimidinic site) lyase n=1 Tax=Zhihengliuella salsuginis TaxID=578222 RepID=A0ABQ3GCP2_9MICC|nr:DNA-formamidopyrimidine glycosylase family protein [Zhihengliuella salsuginis]GHD01803.1 formamidopyrimidine-DNA glycosylase [Zhihengliuella salsuginis]